jgi:3-methyl-2-oxobutanoate hydroxymethyltransferase
MTRLTALGKRVLSSGSAQAKMSAIALQRKKRLGERITMVTAYDYPSALHCERAGIDVILVGDSLGMVELGYSTTQPVTLDEMIHHAKAVGRGAQSPLLVGDLPFGTYEVSPAQGLESAYRYVKEAGVDCVKLEGGRMRADTVRKIVDGGVAVMGHVGLTPQHISVLGGFRAQGRTAAKARMILDDALALQDAGAFAIVIECVPAPVAAAITAELEIPTIGIGAGGGTDGQVLVYHDMLGMTTHPHYKQFIPKFCKSFVDCGSLVAEGLEAYKAQVQSGAFPADDHSPYKMSAAELEVFDRMLAERKQGSADVDERRAKIKRRIGEADEYETVGLYGDQGSSQEGSRS